MLSILQGIGFGMEFPARQALIPQLCSRENVPAALAFNSTTFQVGTFLGPIIAGYLITAYGTGASILMFAVTNYWMAFMIFLIRFRTSAREEKTRTRFFDEIAGWVSIYRCDPRITAFVCDEPYNGGSVTSLY